VPAASRPAADKYGLLDHERARGRRRHDGGPASKFCVGAAGRQLTAEATVLQVTRNVGFAEGELRGPDGTLLAHATATCAIFRPKPAG
jgi:hypothetical protein